jgi:hypothetical protein
MGKFTEWAKANNLTQEAAQQAVNLAAEIQQGTSTQLQEATKAFYADIGGMPDTWEASTKVDKEFGGDKFDENLAIAARARDQFGTPELRTLLQKTAVGNHPEVVRFFYRVGQAISQDGFVPGKSGTPGTRDARGMYANSNMNP